MLILELVFLCAPSKRGQAPFLTCSIYLRILIQEQVRKGGLPPLFTSRR